MDSQSLVFVDAESEDMDDADQIDLPVYRQTKADARRISDEFVIKQRMSQAIVETPVVNYPLRRQISEQDKTRLKYGGKEDLSLDLFVQARTASLNKKQRFIAE